jgi:serine/threonine protein phosphatase PrpC
LLSPAAIDSDTGYRYYAPGQLRDARLVDALRRANVPLSVIATALRDPTAFDTAGWRRVLDDESTARRAALDEALDLLSVGHEQAPGTEGLEMMTLTVAARTERGSSRASNEDAAIVGDRVAGVADGMGGAPGGDIASALAANIVVAGFAGTGAGELAAVVRSANAAIRDRAASDARLGGMGTTLCCAGLVDEDGSVAVVNVGDSRAYLLHGGELRQITEDHSITAEMVRLGTLAASEVPQHPHRHVLTRVLGGGPSVEADVAIIDLVGDDLLMLCTDGLTNEVADDEIAHLMLLGGTPAEVADRLVGHALAAAAEDDVTVVVVRRPPEALSRTEDVRA